MKLRSKNLGNMKREKEIFMVFFVDFITLRLEHETSYILCIFVHNTSIFNGRQYFGLGLCGSCMKQT